MTLINATRLLVAGTLLSASAVAQSRFCVGGDLAQLSPAQRRACDTKLQAVRRVATALHVPDEWHFVLVCGDEGWKDYSAAFHGGPDVLETRTADTNVEEHETFFRESKLDPQDSQTFLGIVAHEVASAMLHSKDETSIRLAMRRLHPDLQVPEAL